MLCRHFYYFLLICLFALNANAQFDISKSNNSSKPIEITSDSLEVLQEESKGIFSGNVEAKQGDVDIRSQKMIVYYKKSDSSKKTNENKISKVEIQDNVFISTPRETAKGNKGVYDLDTGIITLEEDVSLTSGKNIVKGQKLVYNLKTGQSTIVSGKGGVNPKTGKKERVHGVFVPDKKN